MIFVFCSGSLLSKYLVDFFAKIEIEQLKCFRHNQNKRIVDEYIHLKKCNWKKRSEWWSIRKIDSTYLSFSNLNIHSICMLYCYYIFSIGILENKLITIIIYIKHNKYDAIYNKCVTNKIKIKVKLKCFLFKFWTSLHQVLNNELIKV